MRVCVWPADLDAPACYRLLFPARELTAHGHQAMLPPHTMDPTAPAGTPRAMLDLDDLYRVRADVVVLHQPKQASFVEAVRVLRELGARVVVDVDDWYEGIPAYNAGLEGSRAYDTEYKVFGESQLLRTRTRREVSRAWLPRIIGEADLVTCSTPFLAGGYAKLNPRVCVLRNYLDWGMWENVEQQSEVERPGGRIRVGWMGRVEWRSGDLRVLQGIIEPFLRKHPNVDFVGAGCPDAHDLLGVPEGQRVSYEPIAFRELRQPDITAVMDIGLVPLDSNPFNEAKSHLKGMEYAACGIPCVATPTESYKDYWFEGKEGEVGFLARRAHDWVRHLETLVGDDDLRRRMGRAARARAAEHTIQQHYTQWEDTYANLLGDRPNHRPGHASEGGRVGLPAAPPRRRDRHRPRRAAASQGSPPQHRFENR